MAEPKPTSSKDSFYKEIFERLAGVEVDERTLEYTVPGRRLFRHLKNINIKKIFATYSGGGDSGWFNNLTITDIENNRISALELENRLSEHAESFADQILDALDEHKTDMNLTDAIHYYLYVLLPSGFEIDAGSEGSFTVDVQSGTISLNHTGLEYPIVCTCNDDRWCTCQPESAHSYVRSWKFDTNFNPVEV